MSSAKTLHAFKDDSLGLEARIVAAISSVGPRNVAQIARLTGAHQETIRYKVKKQFAERGFRFQAEVDYRKLGLQLQWATIRISPPYHASASRFFDALNKTAYLVHYSKFLPEGSFVSLFAPPAGRGYELGTLLEALRRKKVIEDFQLDAVVVERHKPMDVRNFDFQKARWEVDWQRVKRSEGLPLPDDPVEAVGVADGIDLRIIKELQIDELQHTVGIARKLRINEKTLEYHYRNHVRGKRLVPRYRVRWMRDFTSAVTHPALVVVMKFSIHEEKLFRQVQSVVNSIPFLWTEYKLKNGEYVAMLGVPLTELMEMMAFMDEVLPLSKAKPDVGYMKVGESFNYTIPYARFSESGWDFDARTAKEAVLKELSRNVQR